MSYSSRVYRQRNPKTQDESKEKPFFSKQKQNQKGKYNNSFFQAKPAINKPGDNYEKEADSVADSVINQGQGKSIQRLATTSEEEKVSSNDERMGRDKEKPFQRKPAEQEKEKEKIVQKKDDPLKEKEKAIQKKDDPLKEKEKAVQKKGEDEKKEKEVQKKDDPSKEKEKIKSK